MDNPLTVSLLVTAIGMAVVFLAMALIYGAMQLLTAVARDRKQEPVEPASPLPVETSEGNRASDVSRLRAAAIAVALARTQGMGVQGAPCRASTSGETTPWGEFYRQRHLGARGRGRIG
jgi:Na+-transporting methylmalonyl-CoA/oxaloacetate decarboxylase gamma subunit